MGRLNTHVCPYVLYFIHFKNRKQFYTKHQFSDVSRSSKTRVKIWERSEEGGRVQLKYVTFELDISYFFHANDVGPRLICSFLLKGCPLRRGS